MVAAVVEGFCYADCLFRTNGNAQLTTLAQPLIYGYLSLCCHGLSDTLLFGIRGYVTSKRGAVQSVFRVLAKVLRIRYLKQSDF